MKRKLAKMETLVLITLSLLISVEVFPQATGSSPVLQTTVMTERPFYAQGELVKITGNTTDTTGTPISGSTVALEVHDTSSNIVFLDITTTYVNGSFSDSFRLAVAAPSGMYTVYAVASKAGYASAQNQTTFSVGSSTGVAFAVWTQKSQYMRFENVLVYGRVLYNRTALQDALVTFNIVFPNETTWTTITNTTDATGTTTQTFNLPSTIPAGQYQINVSSYKDPYPNATATGTFTIQNREPIIYQVTVNPLVIQKPGSTNIQANASDYENYQNITVICIITLANGTIKLYNMSLVNSIFSLQYSVPIDYPSGAYSVTIRAVDKDSGSAKYSTNFQVVTPIVKGAACGFILNKTGQAITNATVTLSLNTGFLTYTTTTDSQGYFIFDATMPGQYSIIVSAQEYQSQTKSIQITGNQTSNQNVVLSHLPILTGYVSTNNGQPISNASIVVTGSSGSAGVGRSAPDGSYRLVILSTGVFSATASASRFSPNTTGIVCNLEQTTQTNFSLTENGAVTGQVLDGLSNNGVANATVVIYSPQFTGSCQTGSDGSFYNSLTPGNYTLIVGAANYLTNSSVISVYSNQTTTLQIELMPTGNITGTVKDCERGEPVQNALVSLFNQNGATLAAVFSDATGGYLFYLVPPANYTLAVYAYGYNATSINVNILPLSSLMVNFTLSPSIIFLDVESSSPQFSRGETVSFTITPMNAQGQPISNVSEVTATLKGPLNETRDLGCVQQGSSFLANYTFLNNETVGIWTATFFVRDSLGNTAEALQSIRVMDAFLIYFQTDKFVYVSTENVNFTAYVMRYSNTSLLLNASEVSASVEVFDPQNISISDFGLARTADSFSGTFALLGLEKGTYTANLSVSDSNGGSANAALSFTISEDFQATVQTDKALYNLTDTVRITGSLKFTNETLLADTNLLLSFTVKGLVQTYVLTTDNLGNFEFLFTPHGTAGKYTVICSATVEEITRNSMADFSLLGLVIDPSHPVVNMPAGASYDLAVQLANTGEVTLTGVSIEFSPTSANGVSVSIVNFTQNVLAPETSTSFFLYISVSTGASPDATFNLTASSNEGSVALGMLDVHVYPATPVMDWTPQIIDLSLSPGEYMTEKVTVKNIGYGSLNNVSIAPPSAPWIVVTSTSLGDIAPQESKSFDVLIAPPNNTSLGLYQDQLFISSSNYETEPVYLDIKLTTAQNGSLAFHITDDAGEKVAKATVTIQYQEYYTQAQTALTDSSGYCLFSSLLGGRYSYTIMADKHETVSGTTMVQPDTTVDVGEVLPVKMMDVSFNVLPTTINDYYYITLNITFETNVPKPLLIPVPSVLQFGADRVAVIKEGFAQTMSFDLRNIGLIPVNDVSITVEDGAPQNYSVTLGVFGKTLPLREIAGGTDIQIPCTLTVAQGTDITSLDNGVVCKINITGCFVYFDENDNPLTAQVNAEVLVQILNKGNRLLGVNPPIIFEFAQNSISLTWPIKPLPVVTITNRAEAEHVNLYSIAKGIVPSFGLDITGLELGAFLVEGQIAKNSPGLEQPINLGVLDPWILMGMAGVEIGNWINLQPNEEALLHSWVFPIPLSPADLVKMFLNLPGYSVSMGFVGFWYRWQYDTFPRLYAIPIVLLEVTTFSISFPVIAGPSGGGGSGGGGGGGSGSGWWGPGQTNITVAPPHISRAGPLSKPPVIIVEPIPISNVHEVVKLSISQQATLERDAFQANLQLTNTMSSNSIEKVRATLNIEYLNGTDAKQNFYFSISCLQGISDVAGTGTILAGASASASWVIIPKPGAGGTSDTGVYYTIQAQIFYSVNQLAFNLSSSVETICVQPQPFLTIDYYLPQNVKANAPFKLGIRVTNNGYGTAHDFSIDSAQPTIYDNLSHLPISFQLVASHVEGTQISNSLMMNFGDIAPGEVRMGYWLMVCSLRGFFTNFTATYTHSNALGGEETSLITVNTHILLREIMLNDKSFAFLVSPDNSTAPDQVVDPSSGNSASVIPVSYNIVYQNSASLTIQTEKLPENWVWIPVDDPYSNQKSILEIQRSDGKILNPLNYWMANGKILIVDDPEENYTILYSLPTDLAVDGLTLSKTVVGQGLSMYFNATVENQGLSTASFNLTIYANSTPINTTLVTLTNGSAIIITFTWNTTSHDKGNYTISAYAWPVPGETNTDDNNFTGGWVIVSLVGDITGLDGWPDGKIDMRDIGLVARHFGETIPPAPANCDLTGPATGVPDGKIDMRDIGIVAKHFGEHYP